MISKNNTPVNEFSDSLWRDIETRLQAACAETNGPRIAAFDADGTLWDTDIGETFFDYEIHHCPLAGLPKDPWAHYLEWKKTDPTAAYLWLAQINAGHSLAQVRAWAKTSFERMPELPVFESQQKLIARLRELEFDVYVVTASIKWAVEPAAAVYGVDFDHVLGITTKIKDGKVSAEGVLPITWRAGKAEALLKATGGIRPLLCSGNTFGDSALLETASHIRLAVSTQSEPTPLYEEERKLRDEARSRGWLTHAFRRLK